MFYKFSKQRKKQIVSVKINQLNKLVLKSLLREPSFISLHRFYFQFKLNNFTVKSSNSNFRSRCLVSDYPRSFVRYFKLSRHTAKEYAPDGYLNGIRKSSF